jgi:hypothetical protein
MRKQAYFAIVIVLVFGIVLIFGVLKMKMGSIVGQFLCVFKLPFQLSGSPGSIAPKNKEIQLILIFTRR